MVRRLVRFDTDSESPEDFCEECHDTGFGGDLGPGWRGNNEIGPCACDQRKRARRNNARRNAKPPNDKLSDGDLVRCPICDVKFKAKARGALVLIGGGSWKGMDVIRCPKCLRRERTPNVKAEP